jgi:hypothetical protein
MSRRVCRFNETREGCRKGDNCPFLHTGTSSRESRESGASPARQPARPTSKAPRGVCNFYWERGQCKREFDCIFEHKINPSIGADKTKHHAASPTAMDSIAPYLTEAGLAKLTGSGSGTDVFFSLGPDNRLSPQQVQQHLRTFISDQYRFAGPPQIYAFLKIINCATTNNSSWVCRADFICCITSDHFLAGLGSRGWTGP